MTEAEWLTSDDPAYLLDCCDNESQCERKLRLLVVGLFRRLWAGSAAPECLRSIEAAERFSDGQITGAVFRRERDRIIRYSRTLKRWPDKEAGLARICVAATRQGRPACGQLIAGIQNCLGLSPDDPADYVKLCDLFRCVFGNPFRPIAFDPAWRTSTVLGLASSIYESHSFHNLPVLADALEDAGCTDESLLGHLRGGGVHVRGCFALDFCLNKG